MRPIYELRAWVAEGKRRAPFYLRISEARQGTGGEDFYCCVRAPELFKNDKEIFGVDQAQACELAVRFVRSVLAGKNIVDEAGYRIDFNRIL